MIKGFLAIILLLSSANVKAASELDPMGVHAACMIVINEDTSKPTFTWNETDGYLTKEAKNNIPLLSVDHRSYHADIFKSQSNGDLTGLRAVLSKNGKNMAEGDIPVSLTEVRENYEVISKGTVPSFNISGYDNGKKVRLYCSIIGTR